MTHIYSGLLRPMLTILLTKECSDLTNHLDGLALE